MAQTIISIKIETGMMDRVIIKGVVSNLGKTIQLGINKGVTLVIQIETQLHNRETSHSRIRGPGSD